MKVKSVKLLLIIFCMLLYSCNTAIDQLNNGLAYCEIGDKTIFFNERFIWKFENNDNLDGKRNCLIFTFSKISSKKYARLIFCIPPNMRGNETIQVQNKSFGIGLGRTNIYCEYCPELKKSYETYFSSEGNIELKSQKIGNNLLLIYFCMLKNSNGTNHIKLNNGIIILKKYF